MTTDEILTKQAVKATKLARLKPMWLKKRQLTKAIQNTTADFGGKS